MARRSKVRLCEEIRKACDPEVDSIMTSDLSDTMRVSETSRGATARLRKWGTTASAPK